MQQARKRAGLSASAAAPLLTVDRRTLHNWETGAVQAPAIAVLRMCDLYQCSADWLLSPPGTIRALHDPEAERLAVTAPDTRTYVEHAHAVSVFVTDRLRPITSAEQWVETMQRVWKAGVKIRGGSDDGT